VIEIRLKPVYLVEVQQGFLEAGQTRVINGLRPVCGPVVGDCLLKSGNRHRNVVQHRVGFRVHDAEAQIGEFLKRLGLLRRIVCKRYARKTLHQAERQRIQHPVRSHILDVFVGF